MRIRLMKFIYSALTISGIGISKVSAQPASSDTTTLLAAVSKKDVENKSSIIPDNIVFPDILQNCKQQSLNYIEKFCDTKRAFLLQTYETGKKYFPKIIAVLKKFQLPEELKVLIALESGFSGNAVSKAGAVGYWQIMSPIAKEYGLHISPANENRTAKSGRKDERKNLGKSTTAAAKYFRDQQSNFNNDILLMVASYNCGIGTINRAIKKCHKPGAGFWDVKDLLPKETRNYVMNFISLNVILSNYENFANRQLLFEPKIISIPFQTQDNNSSTSPLIVD